MSMCRVFSCVVGRGCLLWPVCSWQNSNSLGPAPFHIPRPNLPVTPGVSWLPTFAFQSPVAKGHIILVLVLEGVVDLHRTIQFQLLEHQWVGHRFGLLWCWMVCLRNKPRSFYHFAIAPKYCISDSPVGYEGYYISSNRFFPTIVDIMVIWIKLTHSHPF